MLMTVHYGDNISLALRSFLNFFRGLSVSILLSLLCTLIVDIEQLSLFVVVNDDDIVSSVLLSSFKSSDNSNCASCESTAIIPS